MRILHTKDSLALSTFAFRYPGWHTYKNDKRTLKALNRAETLGSIESNTFRQFRARDESNKSNYSVNEMIKENSRLRTF